MWNFYKRIWQVTGRQQIWLIVLSLVVAGLAAAPLKYQKDIINSLGPDLEISVLAWMCGGYLTIIIVTNVFKFLLNYSSSILGEATIRRIRAGVYQAKFNPDAKQSRNTGTISAIITAEAEEVGKFVGSAIANPLLQIGTLISVVGYVISTQPYLGGFLVLVVAPQALIVVVLQKRVNARVKERTIVLRHSASEISEEELETVQAAQQSILDDFDTIYTVRRGIFKLKLSMKFAMNLFSGFGLVGLLMIGGLLMMNGHSDIGTLVASISALEKINSPWRLLLNYYKELSAARVKFDLIVGDRPEMRPT